MAGRLIFCIGNPQRRDDGLGPRLFARLEAALLAGELADVDVDCDYQATVEDAYDVSLHAQVLFVDATTNGAEPFEFLPLEPMLEPSFSTHSVHPAGVLGFARDLFDWRGQAWTLGVRGYDFSVFEEELTEPAAQNLEAAWEFLKGWIRG